MGEAKTMVGISPRAVMRRRQVIVAATTCFRRFGFHSASMAQVAQEAGMSVGHIYRYFSGKEEIIAAIVRDQLDIVLARFPTTAEAAGNVPAILLKNARNAVRRAHDLDWATMMLEVLAEAARNPVVAATVRAADAEVAARVRELVVSGFAPGCVPDDIDQRMEMMALAIESATFRRVSHPEMDPAVIDRLLKLIVAAIFAPSPDNPGATPG